MDKPLVVVFNAKKYIKNAHQLRTSEDAIGHMNRLVKKAIDHASVRALLAGRKTVMGHDFETLDIDGATDAIAKA